MAVRALLLPSLFAALATLGAFSACSGDDDDVMHPDASDAGDSAANSDAAEAGPLPKGDRILGLSVPVQTQSFDDGTVIAKDAGATIDNVTFAWDDVETAVDGGTDDAGDGGDGGTQTYIFDAFVHVANLTLSTYDEQALLALTALDASGSRAPVELKTLPFDNADLATRYDALTDYVFASSEDVAIPALLVGTEVDVALGDDPAKYTAWAAFVTHAAAHIHAMHPKTKVGFTVRASNLAANASRLSAAWAASDIVGISLLPGLADAHAAAPEDVGAAFDSIAAVVPTDHPIWIHEVGTPTDPAAFGSEASQAAFVSAVFAAWDKHQDRIPVVVFRELLDTQTDVATAQAASYGRTDAPFIAFLASLGLQTATEQPKAGFAALKQEAAARGF